MPGFLFRPFLLLPDSESSSSTSDMDTGRHANGTPPVDNSNLPNREAPLEVEVPEDSTKNVEYFKDHPMDQKIFGSNIHEELAVRWSCYVREGLPVDLRKELLQKHLIPENCKTLSAPILNEELKPILSSQTLKNDNFLSGIQSQVGIGLSILGTVISKKIEKPDQECATNMIEQLIEVGQLFANVHHAMSLKRRFEINPFINEEGRLAARQMAIDEYLFGKEYISKVKSCQEMKKAGKDLSISKKVDLSRPGTSKASSTNLNYQRTYPKTKMREERRGKRRIDRQWRGYQGPSQGQRREYRKAEKNTRPYTSKADRDR
ncbi:uncharacterized protein LOC126747396 [Anthonomus grandis grandis]|uniref:uncharacterized protein LOC126747396 n=1 Tax=Anthonomus grandis grandis TaxID=2921223 RepID=UPI002166A08F|nr:uncharacterized protein LOC126747396 [Anthonomus grandis grandis]